MIKFYSETGEDWLRCPACGEANLHHEKVELFERKEDEKTGLHVVVAGKKISADTNIKGNPSARRHGLRIYFRCEHCPAKPTISFAQHKGATIVDME